VVRREADGVLEPLPPAGTAEPTIILALLVTTTSVSEAAADVEDPARLLRPVMESVDDTKCTFGFGRTRSKHADVQSSIMD